MYATIAGHELEDTPFSQIKINGGHIEVTRRGEGIEVLDDTRRVRVLWAVWAFTDALKQALHE